MNKLFYLLEKARKGVWFLFLLASFSVSAASISGLVWDDTNGDGIRQNSESFMSGIYVTLETSGGTQLDFTQSAGNGTYSFINLAAGTYVIKFANPGGAIFMSQQNAGTDPTRDSDADPFGYTQPIQLLSATAEAKNIDGGFNMLGACFTPVTVQTGAVTCDYKGTVDPDDDVATFDLTASGGTGAWGWDAGSAIQMQPYDVPYSFTVDIVNGFATVSINDHDNTFCTATVSVPCPAPSGTLTFVCDDDMVIFTDPGQMTASPTILFPVGTSTCPVGTVAIVQTSGPISNLPVGISTVCFKATDGCGNEATCCYNIEVKKPCDTKTNNNIIWDLLETSLDANGYPTYKMRVTNNRNMELKWVAFQIPNGMVAKSPAQGSMYTAPSGNQYSVRNPNYSPFYSIRFASKDTGIKNGESDIFCYSLPKQANPWYINTRVRIDPKLYIDAYLDTWDCMPMPIVNNPGTPVTESGAERSGDGDAFKKEFSVYPNPASDRLWLNTEARTAEETLRVRLIGTTGQVVLNHEVNGGNIQDLVLPTGISTGLYLIQVTDANGKEWTQRVFVQ